MRVLIVQTAFIGDVILATAVANSLRAAHPAAEIHFLVRKGNDALLANHPSIDKVWVWDKHSGKLRNLWRLAGLLRATRWDYAINLHRFATSGWLMWRLRATEKRGFAKNPFAFCYTRRYPHLIGLPGQPWQHELERNHQVIADLCGTDIPVRPSLHPGPEDYARVAAYTAQSQRVVVAPASVWFTKQWPEEQWAALLTLLPQDIPVYLVGAPGDADLCRRLARYHPQAQALAGELSLLQTAALLQGARRLFANDSAPLHLATSMNTPTTAVFCSTVPSFGFGPRADRSVVIETSEPLSCRPCGLHGKVACPQGHFRCATAIAPQRVADTLCE
ncbi:MAG: glycosyltransferase family 9 protein [Bacteroidetes bacterium]|nr:glycosyltransferase family 9 protein [Bacteroidota bacterium]